MSGARRLSVYPKDHLFRIRCEPCGRYGQLRQATLIKDMGGDAALPDVLSRLCKKDRTVGLEPCFAYYVKLDCL